MNVLIIEDEVSAVSTLTHLLKQIDNTIEVRAVIDSVEEAIDYLQANSDHELIFMDIHLADGNSFEILKNVTIEAPIIFTTAYDQYAIQAFKVNSIDYLLKPIGEEDLQRALDKYKKQHKNTGIAQAKIDKLIQSVQSTNKSYKKTYLLKKGDTITPVASADFAFFYIENGVVRGTTHDQKTYHLDGKLEDIELELDPQLFFRANRQYLVQRSAIKDLSIYFNGRLIVNLLPAAKEQVIISKATAPRFKAWLAEA